jgi:Fe-S cluster assembly iron-binding protein IscA
MALDEPKENDNSYDVKGFKFVVDKEFMAQAKLIKIDFTGMGFSLDSKLEMGDSACGSCGTKGSCCS